MFGLGSDVMSLQEMLSDVPAESANTALYDSAMKMFQSDLKMPNLIWDASLFFIAKKLFRYKKFIFNHSNRWLIYYLLLNQMVNEQMYKLMQLIAAQREKVAFIDAQLFDEIKSAAIKILS